MNNFQNNFGKFLPLQTVLANPTGIYRTENKKLQQETRNLQKLVETKTSEALKIFYESKTFKPEEPHCNWNVKKKISRVMSAKANVEGKTKSKKIHTKTKGDVNLGIHEYKKPFVRKKSKTQTGLKKQVSHKTYILALGKDEEAVEKHKKVFETAHRKSLSNPNKTIVEAEKKQETKLSSFPTTPTIMRKISERSTKPSETKAVILDAGKKHINDILKNHAQRTQSPTVKTLLLKELNLVKEKNQQQKTSVSNIKSGATGEKPEEKQSTKQEKSPAKVRESKQELQEAEGTEGKKKLPTPVLSSPTSRELERRLNNSRHESVAKFDTSEQNTDDEAFSGSSGKTERRVTYTDRLLKTKLNSKVEEKKKTESKETPKEKKKVQNSDSTGKSETVFIEKPAGLLKDILALDEKETINKPKQTSSTELRDLVTQAIREHKIFCIFDNHSYIVRPVREELLSRGWLEVIPDRRLIPRRRPPPSGPVLERDKNTINEQNCNSLQAILAAKETFASEIEETVSKSSFKLMDKTKMLSLVPKVVSKKSEESLNEVVSQFRIMPPNNEKKKNNIEIRDFVIKYQTYLTKEKERELEMRKIRERDDNFRLKKKEREGSKEKAKRETNELKAYSEESIPLAKNSLSVQNIATFIQSNKKTIQEAKMNFKILDLPEENLSEPVEEKPKESSDIIEEKSKQNKVFSFKSSYTDSESKAISKMIQSSNARIHFMWLSIKPGIHLKCFNYSPEIVNKFQKTTFCTKIGLWSHLNNMQWYAHEVHHPAKSPRMYNTGEADDLQAFFQDFHLTACIGLLKWLCDTLFEKGLKAVQTKKGKVPLKAFEFAIKQCERYMRYKENEELNLLEEPKLSQDEWSTFLQYFYSITNDNGKIQEGSSAQIMVIYTKGMETLKAMRRHWPEIDIDGRLNIWIMKPYCASCGRGIFMTNNVYYIGQHSKYIVQKYIEKPLLIYNTKFDIRQWFMITKLTPLEIWMYRECYLRFCSQPFALRNLHESVHLSNNSVQRKYISIRDPSLPDQNMWDSSTFQLYLKTIGFPNAWEEIIYPGMRDAIVSTMLAAQDTFDGPRRSWFEVYGADFMLSANVKEGPWLIEINENPAMDPSTRVTSRLCPQMLRDVIKVVVDKRANRNASTGQWELVYRQNYSPSFGTVDIDVRGKRIARIPYSSNGTSSMTKLIKHSKKDTPTKDAGNRMYDYVRGYKTSKADFNLERR